MATYQRLPKWPAMLGRFTRYGDVLELLTARDDRLVVMCAGDETTLRFAAIDPPPAGWKRDFLLYSVGWDKDANLQTVLGQSSEPLPFQAMSGLSLAARRANARFARVSRVSAEISNPPPVACVLKRGAKVPGHAHVPDHGSPQPVH